MNIQKLAKETAKKKCEEFQRSRISSEVINGPHSAGRRGLAVRILSPAPRQQKSEHIARLFVR